MGISIDESKFNMTATQVHLFPGLCARTFCAKLRDIRLTITAKIRRHNSVLFSYFYLIYFQKVRKSYLLKTMLKVLKVLQIQEFLTVSTRFSTRRKHHILSKHVISTVNISYFNFFQSRKQWHEILFCEVRMQGKVNSKSHQPRKLRHPLIDISVW